MKHTEFKKEFAKLPNDNILRDHIFTIEFLAENFKASYDLLGMHKFVENQNTLWKNIPANQKFEQSKKFFSRLLNTIENSILDNLRSTDFIRDINRQLTNVNNTVLLGNSPKTIFLTSVNSASPHFFIGAFDALVETIQSHLLSSNNYLKGVILSTNFETQNLNIASLNETEQLSFSDLRNKFEQDNYESRQSFDNMLTEAKSDSEAQIGHLEKLWDDWGEHFAKMSQEKQENDNKLIERATSSASRLFRKSIRAKMNLEQKYREHMTFEVPAQHWRTRANDLNMEGQKFMRWLVGLVIVGAASLFTLLWITPDDMLTSIFSNEPVQAIRWSIIFVTFISFLFFGIQALKKAMFSSFHLARDAEERERLTLFYLSLIKDATISQEDRHLVLQSLFSRSDTGMLKDEGSPTMPGIFDKFK